MSIIDEQSGAMRRLESVQTRLWGLASSFEMTGNNEVATKLRQMVVELEEIEKACDDIFYRHNDNAYKQAQAATANMLGAALAMTDLRKEQS